MARTQDLVGIVEIAERLDVKRETVDRWILRTSKGTLPVPFPNPDYRVSGHPVWTWPRVRAWAKATGRLEEQEE